MIDLRVHQISQMSSAGSYVVVFDADVDFIAGARSVALDSGSAASSRENEEALKAIQRGAEKVLSPLGLGASINVRRVVIHPVDFKPDRFEQFTAEELHRMLRLDQQSTVRIWHENLAVVDTAGRRPITEMKLFDDVHGGLRLEINGRLVPHLGYWGPDDVCMPAWLKELSLAATALQSADGQHTFDEGEQGQPAFVFERSNDVGLFSITASKLSDGQSDPDWQRVGFAPMDLVVASALFRQRFFADLRSAAPRSAEEWIAKHGGCTPKN